MFGKRSKWYNFCHSLGRCAFGIDTDLQNNPDNMYLKKVGEIFGRNIMSNVFIRYTQLLPAAATIVGRLFVFINKTRTFINNQLLPLVSEKQLQEFPSVWLMNRLPPILEHREQTPTSRIDLLQLMLQVMTKDVINVSNIY